MKAMAYFRVGNDNQMDMFGALEQQKKQMMVYAKEHNMDVQQIYQDIGYSGQCYDRPALQALLKDAKSGRFDVMLVHNLNRLGRDSFQTANIVKQLHEAKVQVRTMAGPVDVGPLDPEVYVRYMKQHKVKR